MSRPALRLAISLLAGLALAAPLGAVGPPAGTQTVGVAAVDGTTKYNVRLSGFGFRRAESEGVSQRIWAKALAFGKDEPAVVIAVDNLGVPEAVVAEVARRLAKKGVSRDRLAVTASHTH